MSDKYARLRDLVSPEATGMCFEMDDDDWALLAELLAERERLLRGEFTPEEIHGICHNLHGTVSAEEFAAGCEAEMRKLYGRCPWTERSQAERRVLEAAKAVYRESTEETRDALDAATDALLALEAKED